jgi:protein phosphatase
MEVREPVFAMLSNRGRVRHGNEDACGARAEIGAFVVCDGMGGAAAGEVASQLAVDTFLASLKATHPAGRSGHARGKVNGEARRGARARLEAAIAEANDVVYRQSRETRTQRGMGTTLVALMLDDAPVPELASNAHSNGAHSNGADAGRESGPDTTTLWLAHVGDSRCYLLRGCELTQLTEDHSLVEAQVRAGILSRLQAETSPIRNIITRAIGSYPTVDAEINSHSARPGDVFLLASDGLTRELEDAEIAGIIRAELAGDSSEAALNRACQALIDGANARGGGDNITVLLVHFR